MKPAEEKKKQKQLCSTKELNDIYITVTIIYARKYYYIEITVK